MYRIALCENNDDDKKWIKTLLDPELFTGQYLN